MKLCTAVFVITAFVGLAEACGMGRRPCKMGERCVHNRCVIGEMETYLGRSCRGNHECLLGEDCYISGINDKGRCVKRSRCNGSRPCPKGEYCDGGRIPFPTGKCVKSPPYSPYAQS